MSEEDEAALKAHESLLDKKIDDYFEALKNGVIEEYNAFSECDYNKVSTLI